MIIVFVRVMAIFSLIFLGFISNKIGILPFESRKHLINLMMYITAPCMAASSIYTKTLSEEVLNSTFQISVTAAIYFVVISVISYFIVRMGKFKPIEEMGLYMVAMTCINTGFMGFPVTKAVFGGDIFYLMVMHNVVSCMYLYGAVPILLKIGRKNVESHFLQNLKDILNPAMIGIFVGILFLALGIQPPKAINEVIIYLSDATIPLSMIIIGVQLGSSNMMEVIKHKYVNLVNIFSMFVFPILTFFVVEQFDMLETNVKVVLIFASAFPAAVVPSAIAEQQGLQTNRLAEVISLTTLTSLIIIPICATFLTAYYGL